MKGKLICGLDEAGRGPLAGPVYAACVHIPDQDRGEAFWHDVTDSKKLSAKKREALFEQICNHSIFAIKSCDVAEIDELNILQASLLAMTKALHSVTNTLDSPRRTHALVDGNQMPRNLTCSAQTVIKGDQLHVQIAAASILAKVTRDNVMVGLHERYPHYDWKSNKGYGCRTHMDALLDHGPSPHHRTSFAPIRKLLNAT